MEPTAHKWNRCQGQVIQTLGSSSYAAKFPIKKSIWLRAKLIEPTRKAARTGTLWMANSAILNMLNSSFFLKPTLESLP